MADEVTTAEAAEILGVTPRHVRWYYHRGLLSGRMVADEFSRRTPLLVFRREDVERFQKPKKSGRPKTNGSERKRKPVAKSGKRNPP
jgi:hypothetical protein